MAFVSSQSTRVLFGAVAISSTVRSVKPNFQQNMIDVTTIADTSKSFIGGLAEWSVDIDGIFDNSTAAGSVHDAMNTPLSASSTVPTSVAQEGFTAGNAVWLLPAKEITYAVNAQLENAVEYSLSLGAATAPALGISLVDLAAVSTTSNTTSRDNTASTANGFVAHLHITAISGTSTPTLTAVVQHSTNNSTWTTLGSFTAATAVGSQVITGTGTVNRYVRVAWTVSGTTPSFTAQVSLGRY